MNNALFVFQIRYNERYAAANAHDSYVVAAASRLKIFVASCRVSRLAFIEPRTSRLRVAGSWLRASPSRRSESSSSETTSRSKKYLQQSSLFSSRCEGV